MGREDVTSIVEATDAGREGELIFRLVYHQCKCKKPFERFWISSMEDTAIREGFARLRPGTEYDALYEAALCPPLGVGLAVSLRLGQLHQMAHAPAHDIPAALQVAVRNVCR